MSSADFHVQTGQIYIIHAYDVLGCSKCDHASLYVLLFFPFCSLLLPVASLLSRSPFSLTCPTKKSNKTCSNMSASSQWHNQYKALHLLQLDHGGTSRKQRLVTCMQAAPQGPEKLPQYHCAKHPLRKNIQCHCSRHLTVQKVSNKLRCCHQQYRLNHSKDILAKMLHLNISRTASAEGCHRSALTCDCCVGLFV